MKKLLTGLTITMIICCGGFGFSQVDQTRSSFFNSTEILKEEATQKDAAILSPAAYQEGLSSMEKASQMYEENATTAEIQSQLDQANTSFSKAIENADEVRGLFSDVMKARTSAMEVGAEAADEKQWKDAEKEFEEATKAQEKGKTSKAAKKAEKAEQMYYDAGLTAMKADALGGAESALDEAKDNKAHKKAKQTYKMAESSYEMGVESLEESKQITDEAIEYAAQAEYEARHATQIAQTVKSEKKMTDEEKLLQHEQHLATIGTEAGMVATFDQPTEQTVNDIVTQMNDMDEKLNAQNEMIAGYETQLVEMNNKLAASTENVSGMTSRYEDAMEVFNSEEVTVLRNGNKIVLQLRSFAFDVGSAELKPENEPILAKIEEYMTNNPDNTVIIEGHADATGPADFNFELSERRAEAVKTYLEEKGYDVSNVKTLGQGEQHPLETNETKEGRAVNRRVDVMIDVPEE